MVTASIFPRPDLATASSLLASANLPTTDLSEELCKHFFFTGDAAAATALVGLQMLGDFAGICPASCAFMSKQL